MEEVEKKENSCSNFREQPCWNPALDFGKK